MDKNDSEIKLIQIELNKLATIKTIQGGSCFQQKMHNVGISENKKIRLVSKGIFKGPFVVELVDSYRQIVIGYGMASKIIVSVLNG